jgi:hypothetical protein
MRYGVAAYCHHVSLLPISAVPWDGDTADIAGRWFKAFFVFLPARTRSQGASTKNSLLPEPLCGLAARLVLCHTDVFEKVVIPLGQFAQSLSLTAARNPASDLG